MTRLNMGFSFSAISISNHVAMYIGKGKFVEASGGTWSAESIAVKKFTKAKYNKFTYVMRYTGY